MTGCRFAAFTVSFMLLLSACSSHSDDLPGLAQKLSVPLTPAGASQWNQGGNLHFANALEWQKASYQNKRATVADFLAAFDQQYRLNINVSDPSTLRHYSEELTEQLNQKFQMTGPAQENERLFSGQQVAGMILELADANGWLK